MAEYGLDKVLGLPQTVRAAKHVWNQYTIRVPDGRRDELRKHLAAHRIGTEIYYPVPLHEQQCFRSLGYQLGALPETELAARQTLALPIFPELTGDEQQIVVDRIAEYLGAKRGTSGGHSIARPKFLDKSQSRTSAG
jgi:dTDP-4-amino-4,6-dideoxygalactose transaminase